MPAGKKIIDSISLRNREPYNTIERILKFAGIPLTASQILFILNNQPFIKVDGRTNYSVRNRKIDATVTERLKKAVIPIQKLNIKRQRLYEILNIMVEKEVIYKEQDEKKYRAPTKDEIIKSMMPYSTEIEGCQVKYGGTMEEMIKSMKQHAPDPDKIFKNWGKKYMGRPFFNEKTSKEEKYTPIILAQLLDDLAREMRAKFDDKLSLFGVTDSEGFEFALKVKVDKKEVYEKGF